MNKIFYSLFVLAFSLGAYADDTKELVALLQTYETAKGNFEQTLVDAKGQTIQESSGLFTVKSPGYFRWETQQPFPQLLISNLEKIWLYDPDLEQVTIRPYSQSVEQSPALLLSGNVEEITKNYTVKKLSEPADRFVLTPKITGGTFIQLELVFVEATLVSMLLKDSLEQTTTFTFKDLQVNQSVANNFFQFEPPEGVDVLIDER